jgi:segregation and condensation protein A
MMTSEPGEPVLPGEPVVPGETTPAGGGFQVHLDVFEGPFDLLLGLISKHKLDITEIALSSVTDEFIGYIRALAGDWDLDQASYFLVVAATLLDLKAARLLPSGEVDDEEDLALLEARDLLFARLLQYRAYREVSGVLAGRMAAEGKRYPRRVPMEPRFAELLPEVLIGLGPNEFAAIAARVLAPRRPPTVSTAHLHVPRTSVREQAEILLARLRSLRRATFRQLIADCAGTYEVVARFLAVLELYRDGRVGLDQIAPLGDLYVSWAERPEPAESERATPEPPDGGPRDAEPPRAESQDAEPAPAGDRQMHPDEEDGHDDA